MRFRNPANGYEEEVGAAWFWCLLFGSFYFAFKGLWGHAIASGVLAFITFGFSWLLYPFAANQIVETSYRRRGWLAVSEISPAAPPVPSAFAAAPAPPLSPPTPAQLRQTPDWEAARQNWANAWNNPAFVILVMILAVLLGLFVGLRR